MRILLLVLLSAAPAFTTMAAIGETTTELIQRFGKPFHDESNFEYFGTGKGFPKQVVMGRIFGFRAGTLTASAIVVDDKCLLERHEQKDIRKKWKPKQLDEILAANANGLELVQTSKARDEIKWTRSDGATARWDTASGIEIRHPGYETERARIKAVVMAELEAGKNKK